VAVHSYGGTRKVNGTSGQMRHIATPGTTSRIRVINTDRAALRSWVVGAPFRVLAIDGRDLFGPTTIEGSAVLLAAGARADLEVVAPADGSGALVRLGGGADVVVGPQGSVAPDAGRPRLRPAAGGTGLRVRLREPVRLHGGPPGAALDHQRPHLPRRADVPGQRG